MRTHQQLLSFLKEISYGAERVYTLFSMVDRRKKMHRDIMATVLSDFGEERFAKRIARAIVQARTSVPLRTTAELAALGARASPARDPHKRPATRTFQAIRIFVNRELEALGQCLEQSLRVLAGGARLVVISFHSLEDRMVNRFMRDRARGAVLPKGLPVPGLDTRQS